MERSMRFGRGWEGESRGGEAGEMVGLDLVGWSSRRRSKWLRLGLVLRLGSSCGVDISSGSFSRPKIS